jgi:capsular exopolysaccharide synthesis family protein
VTPADVAKLAMALQPQTTSLDAPTLNAGEGALRPYLRAIRAHSRLVVLIVLAALVGGVAYLTLRSPDYEATAQLLISPLSADDTNFRGLSMIRDSGDPVRTVQTAAALIDTQPTAKLAAERLGQGYTPTEVLNQTDVTPVGESDVLAVIGRASDPDEAARLANAFANAALDIRQRVLRDEVAAAIKETQAQLNALPPGSPLAAEPAGRLTQLQTLSDGKDPTLQAAEPAVPPSSAAGPPTPLVIVLSLIAGLTIGSGAALLLELIDWRIRDEDDLLRLATPEALVRVPKLSAREAEAMAGAPLGAPPGIREGFRSLLVQLDRNGSDHRTVMITSASTGDGKTSSAISLAAAVAGAGYRTLLLDLDLRKPNIRTQLGLQSVDDNVLSLITGGSKLSDVLVTTPELPGVQLLLGPSSVDFALVETVIQANTWWLPGILDEAKELADWVIIDTAPLGEVSDALRIASQVDDVVVVARLGQTRRDSFRTMQQLLGHAGTAPAGLIVIGSKAPLAAYGYYMRPGFEPETIGGPEGRRSYTQPGPTQGPPPPTRPGARDGSAVPQGQDGGAGDRRAARRARAAREFRRD